MMETTIEEKTKKEPVLWYVLRAIFGKELEIKKKQAKLVFSFAKILIRIKTTN